MITRSCDFIGRGHSSISHHPAKSCGHRNSGIGDTFMSSQDLTKPSDYMGSLLCLIVEG